MTTSDSNIDILRNKKILQYPLGLGSNENDPYGQANQFMLFKINTDEKASKLKDDESLGGVFIPNTVSTNITGMATQLTSSKNTDSDMIIKYGIEDVNKEQWVMQKGMQRLDKVIVLPMPSDHIVGTSITYTQEYNPSVLSKAGDMVNQIGNGMLGELGTLGKNWAFSGVINSLKSKMTGDLTSMNSLLAEERLVINPKKEVMFTGFGFRQFSFRYTFAPKSLIESEMVNEIIQTFRFYALPEISSTKLFYTMPSEFEVSFMLGQKDNPNIPKIDRSVLQRVSVNYAPKSVWATLPNGAPLSVDMTLDFLELSLIDRKRVYNKDSAITSGY